MVKSYNAEGDVPVWARSSAFLLKPSSSPYGFIDSKGGQHDAASSDELQLKLKTSKHSFDYVWTPASARLAVAEEVELTHPALRKRQSLRASLDISNGLRMTALFGAALLWVIYPLLANGHGGLRAVYSSQFVGLCSLLLLVFGLLPLYSGLKLRRHLRGTDASSLFSEVKEAQFDAWLRGQKAPFTYGLMIGLGVCLIAQLYVQRGHFSFDDSVLKAGLLKETAESFPHIKDGDSWWRMLTAPLLHGNVIHFLMNVSGVLYLGRRIELLARWPHLLAVFFMSMLAGAFASYHWVPDMMAVGASGGLMGLLGFLLAFEMLHPALVPRPARRRLLAGLILMVITGVFGISFIDNAAHAGGVIAGVLYAGVVFPKSGSVRRPIALKRDAVLGYIVGGLLVGSVILAVVKMIA